MRQYQLQVLYCSVQNFEQLILRVNKAESTDKLIWFNFLFNLFLSAGRYTRKASDVDADELAMAGNMIMGLVDEDNDGRLNRSELGVVMEKPKTRLVCKSREFMEMQSSFDAR